MEVPYSNRELREMFSEIKTKLDRIEAQTTKTNGRVRSLEVWRGIVVGGLGVLTTLVLPLLFALIPYAWPR